MKRFFYLFLSLIVCALLSTPTFAGILKGKVTDTKGEPLPFSTVYIQGTATGTTANADGDYQLSLQPGTHKVLCQYMGFKQTSYTVTIKGSETITHDYKLQDQSLELNSVTVKANAEDPAYAIIRKVIAKRKAHLKQIRSFQSSIYLKGVVRNRAMPESIAGLMSKDDAKETKSWMGFDSSGKGILYLCEQEADYYSKEPNKERTYIRSVRQSGNPNGFGLERMPPIVTFYENNVNPLSGVAPRGLISPISDNALMYYKFKYLGDFQENGYTIDKIQVTPKRLYEPLFTGTIYIAEGDWVIHSLNLLATKTANIQTLDTLRIEQTHLPLKKDEWVIKNQVLYPTLNIFGFDISGYFMTVYNGQKINQAIPDTVFDDRIVSQYDKDANQKDTSYWEQNRPVPLEADEVKDYVVKDSIRIMLSDPKFIDSLRKRDNKIKPGAIFLTGIVHNTKAYKNTFHLNPILGLNTPMVSYNTVEGIVVAPKISWRHEIDSYQHINTTVAARYGFSNERFNAIGKVSYRKDAREWRGKWWEIGVQGGSYVFQFNPNSSIYPLYNTFSTLVYAQNYMKLYERIDGTLFFEKNHGNGFRWNAQLNYQERTPLFNTIGYSWAKKPETKLTSNTPIVPETLGWTTHKAAIAKLGLSFRPGYTYTLYPDHKEPNRSRWPLLSLEYTKGIPDILDSKTDYDKWRFAITDEMNLKMLGELSYNVAAGGFLNNKAVAIPDMQHFSDNQYVLAAPYLQSFQMMPYYQYSNTEKIYGEVHLEYAMKGLLTNKIPLLRQAQWYLVLGTNTFYASDKNYYSEAFVGVDNLGYKWARFLRVDVVQSWNSMNMPMTGVRVGFKMAGLVRVSAGDDTRSEW